VRCDDARAAISLRLDGELPDGADVRAVDEHADACAECSRFERHAERVRSALRLEALGAVPDLAPAVLADVGPRENPGRPAVTDGGHPLRSASRPRRPLVVAAALAAIAGLATGVAFVGLGPEPRSPAAADLPDRVLAAQAGIESLDARFQLVEGDGTTGDPWERELEGRLVYEAPESLALTVSDQWSTDADLRLVVNGERWWQSTVRACFPRPDWTGCPDAARRWVRSVQGREPFSESSPVPLELINPVDGFTPAASRPAGLGTRTIAGRRAVGVAVTAAQMGPFLDGLSTGAHLRAVHPGDPVDLWLDDEHLVPLEVRVRAASDPDRARWASGQGATDRAGETVLRFTVTSVTINGPIADDAFATSAGIVPDQVLDAGFRQGGGSGGPFPSDLPEGFRPYRSGTITGTGGPTIAVDSWTDGRAWLAVRSTREWPGGRLFGGLGTSVRTVDLGDAGVAYMSDDGKKVALHGDDIDVVVSGSVAPDELRAVATSLGVTGLGVPRSWDESATATLAQAADAMPGLLVAPELDGFGQPAVRIADGTVIQDYAGAGDRGFTLVQSGVGTLTPPANGDIVGIEVRGAAGRYSAERGQLEWVEGGTTHGLSSYTLTLAELLALAQSLEPV
jgi:Putative zinc-finger